MNLREAKILRRSVIISTAALIAFGLVTLFDIQQSGFSDVRGVADRQLQYLLLGCATFGIGYSMSAGFLKWIARPGLIASLIIMTVSALILRASGNHKIYSAILLGGGRSIQPAEFARFFLILSLAASLSESRLKVKSLRRESLFLLALCGSCFLCTAFLQKDTGTATITLSGSLLFLVLAGVPLRHMGLFAGCALAPTLLFLCLFAETVEKRVSIFWKAIGKFTEQHYQGQMVMRAWVETPWLGMGPGKSIQKFFIPKCHSDFILPIVFQDFGLVGLMAVLAMFALLVFAGFMIARRAATRFEGLVAGGISCMLLSNITLSVMVNLCIIPTTGINLPLLSSGGSSLISILGALGILAGIARRSEPGPGRIGETPGLDRLLGEVSFILQKGIAAAFVVRTKILNLLHHPLACMREAYGEFERR